MADNGLSNLSALKRLAVKIGEYESTDMVPANNVTEAIDILTQILEGPVAPIEDPEFEGTPTAPDITSESPDDAIANKKYVDDSIEMLGTVVDIKGSKATVADLEAITDAEPGDLWFVAETNSEYIYTSDNEWEEFGPTIDLSGYSLSTNLAAEYSASATYAVGDLCTKDSVLYRCNTAISSPEAWTAAHWTATDVITEAQIKNVKDYGLGNVNGALVMNAVDDNIANGAYSTAEGYHTLSSGLYSHAEGHGDTANSATGAQNDGAHSEGYMTKATGIGSHAEGKYTIASGEGSHAEGYGSGINTGSPTASARGAHAEGFSSLANNEGAHAEGKWTKASGRYSHAEGEGSANAVPNEAGAEAAHTEGYHTTIDLNGGIGAHAEGYANHVYGTNCHGMHIEGKSNSSYGGEATHIEGYSNYVKANYAHVEGEGNRVYGKTSHVFGKYSVSDGSNPSNTENTYRTYVEIVGNGTGNNDRSNARTLDWDGNETLAGKLTVGAEPTGDMDVATKKYVDEKQTSGWVVVDPQYIHISSDLTVNKSKICVLKDTINKLIYINAILNCNAKALTTSTKFIDIDDPDICGPDSLTAAIWIDHQSARVVGNTNAYVGYWPCGQIGIADSAVSLSETSGTYPEIGVVSIISSSGVHPLSFRSGGNVNMSSDASYMIISINRTYCYDNWQ